MGGDDLKLLLAAGRNVRETLVRRLPANPARPQKVVKLFGKNPLLSRRKIAGEDFLVSKPLVQRAVKLLA
jgi:hypothetical protein